MSGHRLVLEKHLEGKKNACEAQRARRASSAAHHGQMGVVQHFHSQRCSHPLSLAKAWQLQGWAGGGRSSSPGCPAGWLPTEAFITFSAPRQLQSNTLYYPWATSKPPAGTDPKTEQLAALCQFLGGGEEVSNVSGQGDGATRGAAGRAWRGAGHACPSRAQQPRVDTGGSAGKPTAVRAAAFKARLVHAWLQTWQST